MSRRGLPQHRLSATRRPVAATADISSRRRATSQPPGAGTSTPGAIAGSRMSPSTWSTIGVPAGRPARAPAMSSAATICEAPSIDASPGSRSRAPTSAARASSSGARPQAARCSSPHQPTITANGMPPMKPECDVAGVLRSPWESTQTKQASGARRSAPATKPGTRVHSPRRANGNASAAATASAVPASASARLATSTWAAGGDPIASSTAAGPSCMPEAKYWEAQGTTIGATIRATSSGSCAARRRRRRG